MDLPKKISSIDQKSSSTLKKMKKSSSTSIKAPLSQPMKTRVTAGESLKHAVDLYFKTHDLPTPHLSQSRTNNVTKKTIIPKSKSKEKSEPRARLQSASSKSLRKSADIVTIESQRSNVSRTRLQSASSKSLMKVDDLQPIESTTNVSNLVGVESQQSNVTEIESIAEENELVIDLTSLINEEQQIYNPFEPNLPNPRSLGSFLNFIGPPHPEDNAEGARENRLVDPPNSPIYSSDELINERNNATQTVPSLPQSRSSSICKSATINREFQDNIIKQLQANQQSDSSVYEEAISKSHSNGFSTSNQQSDPSVYEDSISKLHSNGFSTSNHTSMNNIQTNSSHFLSTNANNSFSTENIMEICRSSFTKNCSNTTVDRANSALTVSRADSGLTMGRANSGLTVDRANSKKIPDVAPIAPPQPVVIFSAIRSFIFCYFPFIK